ncbi:indole-3-glycerol phosphate synthase [Sulfurihydrogenibium azorense Az-Fu1]|uniref:Indole-3-glycerol phosphate synthase n=1 Tax=Sulfurihydrogenibium azorense (strain DSM 15241 / OCM 825 / Az-Fu1) TaxID=204536 RepID=C1DUY7_SULAA|nr:indole-3-glycerol phosphate synthase TrpC [Sulfurihydrogenibium azorense]ACN99210.1 indole-3-glycerol phosphate synthase [Sulfurihydrogenibium azorense Az-Fu1]
MNILEKIIQTKKQELENYNDKYVKHLESLSLERKKKVLDFKKALKGKDINIIAEVKKASPSKGVIRHDFDPLTIAKIYEENGAKAISVLTDKQYFQGSIEYLYNISKEVKLPLLRKDFIIDKRQILEAYAYGADSYLLIAKVLTLQEIKEFINFGKELGMEPLVEIHSYDEGVKSLYAGAVIIGINNRSLETFEVDINLSKQLAPKMKELGAEVVVAESGLNTKQELLELKNYQVDAFLIGESLMRERDIGKKLRVLTAS